MFKKTILALATFAIAMIAYVVYQWQDATVSPSEAARPPGRAPVLERLASRPADTQPARTFNLAGRADIPPGEMPMIRVFDERGQAKIVFQCNRWQPLSDTEFHMTDPTVRLLLPGGQLAFVRADQGQVVVQRDENNNYNPKRGSLRGHVRLFVDRTTPQWRRAHPDRSAPEEHPEAVVKMWMDDVSFDLDLARLETAGPILVQSPDATVEGRGLTLVWNEADRRIKLLRIAEGRRASIRMRSLVQLGVGGLVPAEQAEEASAESGETSDSQDVTAGPAPADAGDADDVETETPAVPEAPETDGSGRQIRLADLADIEEEEEADRIDTYRIVFAGEIRGEQREGLKLAGRLDADRLELIRSFGQRERSSVVRVPMTRPAGPPRRPQAGSGPAGSAPAAPGDPATAAAPSAGSGSRIELRWSGEMVVTPEEQDESVSARPAGEVPRPHVFRVVATGEAVRIRDRDMGDARCTRLEYHDETQQVWLTGAPGRPVVLNAGGNRELVGERVFLDRRAGEARVEGAGRMSERREASPDAPQDPLRACMRAGRLDVPVEDDRSVAASWTGGVRIAFGQMPAPRAPGSPGGPARLQREYIRHALFEGDVSFMQNEESVVARRIEAFFDEPFPGGEAVPDRAPVANRVLAEGDVRMTNGADLITCDRLEVEMGIDEVGRNVPRLGRAYGHVIARREGRVVRADDLLEVELASVPREIDPVQRRRLEARARYCGFGPESPEWQAFEARLRARREVIITRMKAVGGVSIIDPAEHVDIAADRLECTLDRGQGVQHALVVGRPDQPARVELEDFYIRGEQITLDTPGQHVEVPGEGLLRLRTRQDLDGREVRDPIPLVISWKGGMTLRGDENNGVFTGRVRAVSENTSLDCRELRLTFEDLEAPATQPAGRAPRIPGWGVWRSDESRRRPQPGASVRARKRLVRAYAVGDAVIASSAYEPPPAPGGVVSALIRRWTPVPSAPEPDPSLVGSRPAGLPLLSYVRVTGPQIVIDLLQQHMVVEGAGNLLVLDYRRPDAAGRRDLDRSGAAFQADSPSQSVFAWENSMSFLNSRNIAVFDRNVTMKHAAGSQMVLPEHAAASMNIDPEMLRKGRGRLAEMTCENLLVEFERDASGRATGPSPLSRAAGLRSFRAAGRVRIQDNNRSAEGDLVTYDRIAGLLRLTGSSSAPARLVELDEKTGALRVGYRGRAVDWNLVTDIITTEEGGILAPGR